MEYTKSRREQSGEHRISNKVATDVLIKLELLPVTNYLPDIELIKKNEGGMGYHIAQCLAQSRSINR